MPLEVTAISSQQFISVLETIQQQISVQSVVAVLGIAAGAAVGLAFMWWGVRKLVRVIMGAFKKGNIPL